MTQQFEVFTQSIHEDRFLVTRCGLKRFDRLPMLMIGEGVVILPILKKINWDKECICSQSQFTQNVFVF